MQWLHSYDILMICKQMLNAGNVHMLQTIPRLQSSWGQHGAHLGPTGPRWDPCWPHESCYKGLYLSSIPKKNWESSERPSDIA